MVGKVGVLLSLLLACCTIPARSENDAVCFVVVVHAENPATEIDPATLAKMLIKRTKKWNHGVAVVPINLVKDSAVRDSFTRAVHGKRVAAIETYWQRMIFSGREIPPATAATDEEVLDFVRGEPGALGYVGCAAVPAPGVKRLDVVAGKDRPPP